MAVDIPAVFDSSGQGPKPLPAGNTLADAAGTPVVGGGSSGQSLSYDGSSPGNQWGMITPRMDPSGQINGSGILQNNVTIAGGSVSDSQDSRGIFIHGGGSFMQIGATDTSGPRTDQDFVAAWRFIHAATPGVSDETELAIADSLAVASGISSGNVLSFRTSGTGNVFFKHGNSSVTSVDSGVSPANVHYYKISVSSSGTSVLFELLDAAGAVLGSTTATTNLPTITTGMFHTLYHNGASFQGKLYFFKLGIGPVV